MRLTDSTTLRPEDCYATLSGHRPPPTLGGAAPDTPDDSGDETVVDDDPDDDPDDGPAFDIAVFPPHRDPRRHLPPPLRRHLRAGTTAAYGAFLASSRITKRPPSSRRQRLACPFVAHNPTGRPRSHACLAHRSMRGLRLHLGSAHRRPIACPLCGAEFAAQRACDAHIVARRCAAPGAPGVRCEGVTDEQLVRLARRDDPALPEPEQWAAVWRTLFPREKPPASPHLPPWLEVLAPAADLLRDFWEREGQRVVAAFARRSGLAGEVEDGDALGLFGAAVLERMVDGLHRPAGGRGGGFGKERLKSSRR